ncbi:MAG: sensor histidine kinase N-terminal domain-containing protein [Proteobacteria bacterium]|nr:sensor histidine kinase N-terminal domain-containing protein [Pseudomonadota bacterium]
MRARRSLRKTTFVWVAVLLAVAGSIAASVAYLYSKSETADFLDGQLRQIALNAGPGLSTAAAPTAADQDPEDRVAVSIWDANGRLVHQSLPGVALPLLPSVGFAVLRINGEAWRVYSLHGAGRSVEVAQRVTVRNEIAGNAAMGVALPVLLLIPLSWLVVGFALHRTLWRLDVLADELATRSVMATEPLPLTDVPAELTPLVAGMNSLIVRLHEALAAQKRFLADAAHTLRTPIAALQIEIGNLTPDVPPARTRLQALAAGARRAAGLVDQLLRLARLDEPQFPRGTLFDAGALLLGCVADQAAFAARKGIDLGADVSSPALILGVEDEARALFTNLIENALTYTPEGGKVDVSLRRDGDWFSAEILDTGAGLPPGAETHIFERFYRAAPEAADGTGLGLAIARRIADRHSFGLDVRNRADGIRGVLARVTMPVAGA